MLGFATVDLSERDHALTVWLTSLDAVRTISEIVHTNAVSFQLDDEASPRRAWSMTVDRYVVLTDRTPRDHPAFAHWGLVPCDLGIVVKQTLVVQEAITAAFAAHVATKRGKAAELIEPVLPAVPPHLDQVALDGQVPEQVTLAVANQVKRTWEAWYTAERERVKRWSYMPGGRKDEKPAVLPAEFTGRSTLQPVRPWAQ